MWATPVDLGASAPATLNADATSQSSALSAPVWTLIKRVGDVFGGELLQYEDQTRNSQIVRVDGVTKQESWRYVSAWQLYRDWALHPDGTIYVGERPAPTRMTSSSLQSTA